MAGRPSPVVRRATPRRVGLRQTVTIAPERHHVTVKLKIDDDSGKGFIFVNQTTVLVLDGETATVDQRHLAQVRPWSSR